MAVLENAQLLSVVDRLAEESHAHATKVAQEQDPDNWQPGYNIILCATLIQTQVDYRPALSTPRSSTTL